MRNTSLILGFTAITLFATANDAFAQRFGVFGGGTYVGVTGSYGSYNYGYYPGFYPYPYGYAPYISGSNGSGFYFSSPIYYYTSPSQTNAAPDHTYSTPDSNSAVSGGTQQTPKSALKAATLTVLAPDADAQIWFNETLTTQRGIERHFHTPPLARTGTYAIKIRWNENSQTMERQREVRVAPGQAQTVDFRK